MELEWDEHGIAFEKRLNALDRFVIDFTRLLTTEYVLVSGYVAILFGRSRGSEDVDMFVAELEEGAVAKMWNALGPAFESITATTPEEAHEYWKEGTAVRFARKGEIIPNVEVKAARTSGQRRALKNRIRVLLNGHEIFIAPIEEQIAYKLFMGSDKDVEDATHLFIVLEERLDKARIIAECRKLEVPPERYPWT